jgi:hypothetical protein
MFTGGINRRSADWQCVIPDVTCRYDVQTLGEATDPMLSCTLKLFPHRPGHCIEWAHHQLNRVLQKRHRCTTFREWVEASVGFAVKKFVLRIRDLQWFHPEVKLLMVYCIGQGTVFIPQNWRWNSTTHI